MTWAQIVAMSGVGLALVVVAMTVHRWRAHQTLETSAHTTDADGRRSPTDHATSDIDGIVRRLALDPEFQAKTAGLLDRARSAQNLEDIGPVVGPDKPAAAHEPIPEEWIIRESTPEAAAADAPPVSELIPEDVLSDMERVTKIVCRSVHELDQHLIRLRLGSWCDELLAFSDGLTTAKVGSQNMRAQMLMLRVRAHWEAHPDFDVRSLLGPKDYVRHLGTTRQFLEQAEDLDDLDVQRAIQRFCEALGIQAQEPSAEETRQRARPLPPRGEMAIENLSDQEAEAFLDTITGRGRPLSQPPRLKRHVRRHQG